MAHFRAEIEVPRPIEEVFRYLAEFENAADWDPGIVSARKLDDGPVRQGTRFEVVSRFLGRDVRLVYAVTQLDPPSRLVLEGEADTVVSVDTLTFAKTGTGTRLVYDAHLRLKGLLYLADLPLHGVFQVLGGRAARGLEEALRRGAGSA